MTMISFRHIASLLLAGMWLATCGDSSGAPSEEAGPTLTIADFPPMASGSPPGAASTTQALAHALGRGVNFGNMFDAPNEGDWDQLFFREAFLDEAHAAGFTTIRLPVRWSNHARATSPFTIDEPFFARIEHVVDEALLRELYVVLDMHHYRQLDGDALDYGEKSVDEEVLEVRFLAMWRQIAARFADKSDKLLFELYNEPHARLDDNAWNDLAARAINVVRETNPERVVVIGPTQWNNAYKLESLKLPNDPYVIVMIHNYEPFAFTHQGAEWITPALPSGVTCCDATQLAQLRAPLALAADWSARHDYPIFLGEFGAYQAADMDARATFTRAMRDAAEDLDMSWAYWELAASFGVYDPVAGAFRAELCDALLGP